MKHILYLICIFILWSGCYLNAQNMSDLTIYINPGHGGFDSDDRNVTIAPYLQGDKNGFWESQSNLDKALQLRTMLEGCGAKVFMSRTTNTSDDDLALSRIVRLANESNADFMLAIHSNAGGTANMVLQLYSGVDPGDTYTYTTPTQYSKEGLEICTIIAQNLYSNEMNVWGNNYSVRGDKTFGRTAMGGWKDGYGVLRGLNIPGAISEGSMHDYIPETYRLMNMEYKWLESWHFLKSFATYYHCGEIPTGNIVGTIHDSHFKNEMEYAKIANSNDCLLPLNKVKVTLNPGNIVYITDQMNNGVYVFKNLQPGSYTVKYENESYYSQEQTIEVKSNNTSYKNVFLDKIRLTPPEILTFSPNVKIDETVLCTVPITFEFNWDIDEESAFQAFSIKPAIDGDITFADSYHKMIFTPKQPFEPNTKYTVRLDKCLKHPGNISMKEDFSFEFVTNSRNRLKLLASYPNNNDDIVHYASPSFLFLFDKTLNTSLIKEKVNIYDTDGNLLAKNARSQLNNKYPEPLGSSYFKLTSDLVAGKQYEMRVASDLLDIDNTPVFDPIVYTFTAADVRSTAGTLVCDFEAADRITYQTDLSNCVKATAGRTNSNKLFDNYSTKLTYSFENDGKAYFSFSEPQVTIDGGKCLGIHIYGDLSGNELQLIMTNISQSADKTYLPLTISNFWGWKYCEVSMKNLPSTKTYRLDGIIIKQNEPLIGSSGEIYLDNMMITDQLTSVSTIADEKIEIYPNPVKNVMTLIGCESSEPKLLLYSPDGRLLRSVTSKTLDMSSFNSGTYILKIIDNDKYYLKKILKE